jgi:opacity protein-like surface antigen
VAPVVACACAAPDFVPVMDNRWSVGLAVGGMGLTPKGSSTSTPFGVGVLSLRYRLGLHLELAASVGGGNESSQDGTTGNLAVSEAVLSARWHFRPQRRWSWYVDAGIGGLTVADQDATSQQRSDASRGLGEVGIGLERRFRHLALAAELQFIGVGAVKQQASTQAAMPASTAIATMPPPPSSAISNADPSASGAQLTFGASYYF